MAEADTVFHETAPGVFVRALTGLERAVCIGSEFGGSTHTTFSIGLTFVKPISAAALKQSLQRVLIRLRFLAPSVACRLCKLPAGDFQFAYTLPKSTDDALVWVNETLFFEEAGDGFNANHERIVRERWWKASDDKYTHQYYITPPGATTQQWTVSLSAHHTNIDGRSAWMIFDKLLLLLTEDLRGIAPPVEDLEWGQEITRLPPTASQTWSVERTGKAEPSLPADPPADPPTGYTPWLYHPLSYNTTMKPGDIVHRINWTTEETARMHAACKKHGRTVTQAVMALLCLGNAEAVFRNAAKTNPDNFREVSAVLSQATHHATGLTSMNMRQYLPASYQTLDSKHSTPLCAVDAFPIPPFDIQPYRKMLQVNNEELEVTRVVDEGVFWNGMVKSIADSWNAVDGSYESFRKHAAASTLPVSKEPQPGPSEGTLPLFTSFGDMSRLGLLQGVHPPLGNSILVVGDIDFTTRSLLPNPHFSFFQYNQQFVVKIVHGNGFASEEDLKMRGDITKEWFNVLFN